MKRFAALAVALLAPLVTAQPLLLTNARIYTGNDAQPRAEAVVCVDGRIAFVGSAADARTRARRQVDPRTPDGLGRGRSG